MASSIRSPTANDNANSVMMLIENPIANIKIKPPNSELGKARPVIKVERADPKKRKTTMIQSKIPKKIDSLTSRTFKRIGTEPSRTKTAFASIFLTANNSFKFVNCVFKRSATATVFAPDCLYTSKNTAFSPLIEEKRLAFSKLSLTVATSDNLTGRSEPM